MLHETITMKPKAQKHDNNTNFLRTVSPHVYHIIQMLMIKPKKEIWNLNLNLEVVYLHTSR